MIFPTKESHLTDCPPVELASPVTLKVIVNSLSPAVPTDARDVDAVKFLYGISLYIL